MAKPIPSYRAFRDVFQLKPREVSKFLSELYGKFGRQLEDAAEAGLGFRPTVYGRPYYEADEILRARRAQEKMRQASATDRFSDLFGSATSWNPVADETLDIATQAVRTGRLGGKKLSSAQRRELALTNEVARNVLEGRSWQGTYTNELTPTDERIRTSLAQLVDEAEQYYPGLLSSTLRSEGTYSGGLKAVPGSYRKDIGRLLEAARKRAVKAEGEVPLSQTRLPGAPPSRTSIVNQITRLLNQGLAREPRWVPVPAVTAKVAQGRRGMMMSELGYLEGKTRTLANRSGFARDPRVGGLDNWKFRFVQQNAENVPDELLPVLREIPALMETEIKYHPHGSVSRSWPAMLEDPIGTLTRYDSLTGNQKAIVNKILEKRPDEKSLNEAITGVTTTNLTPSEMDLVVSMLDEWTEPIEDLFNFAREFAV
jgi:hypothetical protein